MKLTGLLISLIAAVTVGCTSHSGSPATPSGIDSGSAPVVQNTVIWGSYVGPCCQVPPVDFSVDTGTLGNPSPLGSDVTGVITANPANGNRNFAVAYGSVSSGPATVTLPAHAAEVRFTIHTTGTGSDVSVTLTHENLKVPAHVSTNTVIWGS